MEIQQPNEWKRTTIDIIKKHLKNYNRKKMNEYQLDFPELFEIANRELTEENLSKIKEN